MSDLRPNQIEPVRRGIEFFKQESPKPGIIVAPTAFGKSWVIAHICKGIQGKTCILQPSLELLDQNFEKYTALGGKASIYSASKNIKEFGDVTYCTVGTIKTLGSEFKSRGYTNLIIDEVHMYPRGVESMLGSFLRDSGIKKVLGLTATPFKLQTNSVNRENYSILSMLTSRSKKGSFFKDLIHITQIGEIVKDGFWAKLQYKAYDFDSGRLVYNSTKADYTLDSMEESYIDQDIPGKIIQTLESIDRKRIICFVPSVQDAIDLSLEIPNSAAVYSDMPPKDRARIIREFREGKIWVIFNVNILSVGFDYPEIDCIICGRPTASLAWWYQAAGRGTRLHPFKDNCLIIDFAGNTQKFGRLEDLEYRKEKSTWKLYTGNKLLTGVPLDQIKASFIKSLKYI